MKIRLALLSLTATLIAMTASAQTSNPGPKSFVLRVDGADTQGVAGFSIDFERSLDVAYSPRQVIAPAPAPRLSLTLTPKGLAALSGWLNEAGAGGNVSQKTVEILSVDNEGTVLIDWKLDGVAPLAITQLSTGIGNSPTATVVYGFQALTLVSAKAN